MLGASIYLSQNLKEIKDYLSYLSENGVREIFTSMHIIEDDAKETIEKLTEVSAYINNLNMSMMIDISSSTLIKYNMTLVEMIKYLKGIKVKKLRIDYGFNDEEIVQISKDFEIVLNASTIDENNCQKLKSLGLKLSEIIACHNFYPRPETGLSKKVFLAKNEYLKSQGFKIQAFIPGDQSLRGPIFKGLPTIEDHRYKNPLYCYIDLLKNYYVDEVLVGDISIKEETLKKIKLYEEENVITLTVENVCLGDQRLETHFWDIHVNRKDVSEYVVRSAKSRVEINFEIEPYNTIERKKGSVTIDNKQYLRYNGEIQIARKDLVQDDKVNVLANITVSDLDLLQFIDSGTKFKFIK